jgi:hypothetical protein|tara:strand:+ start:14744 stop:14998 length:255 start_codon:yes stop_codon:yes gene_type:complete
VFVLALKGKEDEGAYSVEEETGKTLYLFVDKDDAMRYAGLLEADDYPLMSVVEVSEREAIGACIERNHPYYVITPDQIVIPPDF